MTDDELKDGKMTPHQYLRLLAIQAKENYVKLLRQNIVDEIESGLSFSDLHDPQGLRDNDEFSYCEQRVMRDYSASLDEMVDHLSFVPENLIEPIIMEMQVRQSRLMCGNLGIETPEHFTLKNNWKTI